MSYRYSEPKEPEYEPFIEGDYDFYVTGIQETYTNPNGNFVLPVEIQLKNTNIKIRCWLSAGMSAKGKPFDMIAPFLKCIRKNPAVDEEPDFSAKNLVSSKGSAHCAEELYTGDSLKYKGKMFPGVASWIYDREAVAATISGGSEAAPKTYTQPTAVTEAEKKDNIPF